MESKKYMSMRNDVVEMGFRNMDPFTADLFCLVLRQVKKNIEEDKISNKYVCEFPYSYLKRLGVFDIMQYKYQRKKQNLITCIIKLATGLVFSLGYIGMILR